MPSFSTSTRFREGQWRALRKFVLEERRDATPRVQVILAELQRIGEVRILWDEDEDGVVSEKRVGLFVDPPESSLGKLVSAYVSLGGNPFDISMFMKPDSTIEMADIPVRTQPSGGLAHSLDIQYSYDQGATAGDPNLLKFKSSRYGGIGASVKQAEILGLITRARKWVSKEISYKRTRLEERILKLMDLREQLEEEISDILWATGGHVSADVAYDSSMYNDNLTVAKIVYFFDTRFRNPDPADPYRVPVDDTSEAGAAGSLNTTGLAVYNSLVEDEDEEENTAL